MKIIYYCSFLFMTLLFFTSLIYADSQNQEDIAIQAQVFEDQKAFKKAEELFLRLEKEYPSKKNFLKMGHFYARQKKFKKATRYFYKSINQLTFDYTLLEEVFYQYQLYDELLNLYLKGESETDDRFLKRYFSQQAIQIYKLLSKYDKAIHYIISKIETSKRPDIIYFNALSDIAIKDEHASKVLLELVQLDKKPLNNHQYFMIEDLLGEIYYKLNKYEKSANSYQKAISRDQYQHYHITKLIQQFQLEKQDSLSLRLINSYLNSLLKRKATHNTDQIFLNSMLLKGKLLLLLNAKDQAEVVYEKILSYSKLSGNQYITNQAHLKLGTIYFSNSLYSKAKKMFLKVQDPTSSINHIYIARCYLAEGNYEKANNILLLTGENSQSLYYKSLIFLFQSKINKSIKTFEILIEKYGYTAIATQALIKLEMIQQVKQNKQKLSQFILFEQLWERQDYTILLKKLPEFSDSNLLDENQKAYYQIQFAHIFIQKRDYQQAKSLLNSIKTTSTHLFWIQKSSFLLGKLYIQKLDQKENGLLMLRKLIRDYPKTIFLLPAKELIKKTSPKKKLQN